MEEGSGVGRLKKEKLWVGPSRPFGDGGVKSLRSSIKVEELTVKCWAFHKPRFFFEEKYFYFLDKNHNKIQLIMSLSHPQSQFTVVRTFS